MVLFSTVIPPLSTAPIPPKVLPDMVLFLIKPPQYSANAPTPELLEIVLLVTVKLSPNLLIPPLKLPEMVLSTILRLP
jgi:hypothetical protein